MKTIILLSACILLAIVVENIASPLGNSGSNGSTRPGSCARPVSGRRKRSIEDTEVEIEDDNVHHLIQKRNAQGSGSQGGNQWRPPSNGGSQGGNPWKPPPTTQRPQCAYDTQCPNNKKCCGGQCQTPAFTG